MANLKRISIEVLVIFSIFFFVNYGFGIKQNEEIKKTSFENDASNFIGFQKAISVAKLPTADFMKLLSAYR